MESKITIGITECGKWPNYEKWIAENDPSVNVIKLSYTEDNLEDVIKCDGIVLSGGEDVHPRFYNRPEFYALLDPKDILEQRDEFELKVLEMAQKNFRPVLGICRGLQIANVFFKGTLIPDIPSVTGKTGHGMTDPKTDAVHQVVVLDNTLIKSIVQDQKGTVNSAHHQSADKISDDLKINAVSDNGVVEGLEWKNPTNKPFLLLVQWHPERMLDKETSNFSRNIRERFIKEAREYSKK